MKRKKSKPDNFTLLYFYSYLYQLYWLNDVYILKLNHQTTKTVGTLMKKNSIDIICSVAQKLLTSFGDYKIKSKHKMYHNGNKKSINNEQFPTADFRCE